MLFFYVITVLCNGKQEEREKKKQEKYHVEVISMEGLSFTDDEGYLDCNVPDLHDLLDGSKWSYLWRNVESTINYLI